MRTFQEPGVGEAILGRDVEHTFRSMLRGRGYTASSSTPPRKRSRKSRPASSSPTRSSSVSRSSATRSSPSSDVYSRTGFTGGLNWYRALRRDYEEAQGSEYVIDKPALMVSAADDWFFAAAATDGLEELLPRIEKHVIPTPAIGCSRRSPTRSTPSSSLAAAELRLAPRRRSH